MNKLKKEYKGVLVFYLIIVMAIFLISVKNANLNSKGTNPTANSSIVALNKN